ncbi:MAG: hypothetical protein ACM3N9_00425 [Syntrophothermus sp.]
MEKEIIRSIMILGYNKFDDDERQKHQPVSRKQENRRKGLCFRGYQKILKMKAFVFRGNFPVSKNNNRNSLDTGHDGAEEGVLAALAGTKRRAVIGMGFRKTNRRL